MSSFFEIIIIAILTATSCALLGNFLILRGQSMMTDAISHSVLLGIVLAFLVTESLDSPWLVLGATAMGLLTVWLAEAFIKVKYVSPDSAIGLLFPFFFSIAVMLITHEAGNVHLDTDSVLLGELAFAPFHRLYINGIDIGAAALYSSAGLLLLNSICIFLLYKELSLSTFDNVTAKLMGFSPRLLHYGLMTLVSLTAVVSFQSIGSILVIAFMVAPAMTAALWARTMSGRIFFSILIGAVGSSVGTVSAIVLDTSLAGMIATILGALFILSLLKYRLFNYRKAM